MKCQYCNGGYVARMETGERILCPACQPRDVTEAPDLPPQGWAMADFRNARHKLMMNMDRLIENAHHRGLTERSVRRAIDRLKKASAALTDEA